MAKRRGTQSSRKNQTYEKGGGGKAKEGLGGDGVRVKVGLRLTFICN